MKVYDSLSQLVGRTPLLRLKNFENVFGLSASIYAKLEYFNPAGSAKDRVARQILLDAEEKGLLKKDGTIIEPTSGNTGIALAALATQKGYRVILTMPETMSIERQKLIKAFGAEVVLTDGKKGMQGAIEKAQELKNSIEGSIIAGQFENNANPTAHYLTTGPEIWEDTDGKVDILVCAVGTGGTITGTAKFLKEKNPAIKVIAVEPSASAVLSGKKAGAHKIQGIGAGFIPSVLDTNLIDEVLPVSDDDAFETAKLLSRTDGVFVGISSGAAAFASSIIALKYPEKNIVVVLPDGGERYLSTPNFAD